MELEPDCNLHVLYNNDGLECDADTIHSDWTIFLRKFEMFSIVLTVFVWSINYNIEVI